MGRCWSGCSCYCRLSDAGEEEEGGGEKKGRSEDGVCWAALCLRCVSAANGSHLVAVATGHHHPLIRPGLGRNICI